MKNKFKSAFVHQNIRLSMSGPYIGICTALISSVRSEIFFSDLKYYFANFISLLIGIPDISPAWREDF